MKHLFLIATILSGALLLYYSLIGVDKTMAIVAEVEPQKTAISYPKSIRIKSIKVAPGQSVVKGDLLLEVERPNLLLDIERVLNELKQTASALTEQDKKYTASKEVLVLKYSLDTTSLYQQLRVLRQQFSTDTSAYKPLNIEAKPSSNTFRIKQEALTEELSLLSQKLRSELNALKVNQNLNKEQLLLTKQRLEAELVVLEKEKSQLKQYAPFSGIVGSVSVQLQELVPPYQTIISIYEEHPTIIKAYLNELADVQLSAGQQVDVTSINREYSVEGKVIEIGSRIVSYPKQMKNGVPQEMWGKEIFVEIENDNQFLSGEKVYVIINSGKQ